MTVPQILALMVSIGMLLTIAGLIIYVLADILDDDQHHERNQP